MGAVTKGHRIYRHYPPSEIKTNQTTKPTNKQTATEFLQQSYSGDNSTTESSYSYCCYNHCVCSLSNTDRRLFTLVKGKQNDQIAKLVDFDIWSCLDSLCPCLLKTVVKCFASIIWYAAVFKMLNINVTSLGPKCLPLLHSLFLGNNGYLLLFSFNNHAEQAASISEINCFTN